MSRARYSARRVQAAAKKNRGLLANREAWSLLAELVSMRLSSTGRSPDEPRRFVGTHHKAMTTYFTAVLRPLAFATRLRFETQQFRRPDPRTDLMVAVHTSFDISALAPYRGVHIIRDPRDMVVSSYNYHLWTHERWAHRPGPDGRTYQERLQTSSKTDGYFMEIDHLVESYSDVLRAWDTSDADVLELRFEDLMGPDREELYRQLFRFLQLAPEAQELGFRLMQVFEADSRTGRSDATPAAGRQHVRSARTGQWQGELSPAHLARLESTFGDIMEKFGYS